MLEKVRQRDLTLAKTASCTGGLLGCLLTDQHGFRRFKRGFVTYTHEAKSELRGADLVSIKRHGAVSTELAVAMANERSRARTRP